MFARTHCFGLENISVLCKHGRSVDSVLFKYETKMTQMCVQICCRQQLWHESPATFESQATVLSIFRFYWFHIYFLLDRTLLRKSSASSGV